MPLLSRAPRAYLFTQSRLLTRSFSVASCRASDSKKPPPSLFGSYGGPAPPRLPKEEQEIFEALQRQSTGAFSTPRTPPKINQSPYSSSSEVEQAKSEISERTDKIAEPARVSSFQGEFKRVIEARGKGEELHPEVVRGAAPEFEGEVNPKTGEVGGPKNEPLRWGASGEWTYNGRTTDF